MDLNLEGRTALISGSTKGIGFAAAVLLAREGARVILNGRSDAALAAASQAIASRVPGAKLDGFAGDLATARGCAGIAARFPEVDILVNNVGVFERKAFEEIPDEDWQRLFELNVMSGVRLSRAYLPGMRRRDWGRIVFVSSESALQVPDNMIHYAMTKGAQLTISRGLAETCAGTGVTVNAVMPGPTLTDGNKAAIAKRAPGRPLAEVEKEFFEKVRPSSLLRRYAAPEEIAPLIAYLCSPLSSATNGAALRADGGIIRAAIG
ncbi:MAG TPA: SDR family oxidoreductase [Burkholderiales bacterium]|nr:SDR family oxidoreductase [Burkholderiales bacterium]